MEREFQFYIVPTPIGNLGDITFRAVDILKNVDIIACEDTRNTQKLLNHFDIKTKTISCHKYNEKNKADEIVKIIKSGRKIALVSDAGTPMICDPGNILIKTLREHGITITSLAGACTIPAFLSQVPRENEYFTFVGFLPKPSQKIKDIVTEHNKTHLVFYESPNRIIKTLNLIKEVRGNVTVALGRELTKLYEEVVVDSVDNVIAHFESGVKGEIVCMVYPTLTQSESDVDSKINMLREKGFKSKEIATILSTLYNLNKNDIYKAAMN